MSLRLSSSQSSHLVSLWGGLGIPGSAVPTTGDNGGSPLANDGITSTSEYRIETVTAPSAGTLTVYPDTSYEFTGPDGTYTWTYRVYEDSVDRGTANETLVIGSPVASFFSTTSLPAFSGAASVSGASPETAISATTGLPDFTGSATGYIVALTDSEKIDLILDILSNRQTLDPVSGLYTLYADDGVTVLKTALAWEDAAGTQPYRGQALQRLDPLS
jgi:hypothetical protein